MMQKAADLSSSVKGIPSHIQLLSPGRDYIDQTQVIMKQEYVRIVDGEKVLHEYSKEKYFESEQLENSIKAKNPNATVEFFRKDVNVELILFTDLLFFTEKQKIMLFFGEQTHYHSAWEIKDSSLIIREQEIVILCKDDSIILEFTLMNNMDTWAKLLKEHFDKQHEINEMKERRKTGQF